MLYLTRKIGESIIINNNIELTVVEVRGKTVKLGFLFPQEATILRKELYDRIMEQNLAAASGGGTELLDADIDVNVGAAPQTPVKDEDDGQGNR
jgi:carbon storage regulator